MKNRKILVPIDSSPLSDQTIKRLLALKENITFPLTLLHVLDFSRVSYRGFAQVDFREIEERARENARNFAAEQQKIFADAGLQVDTLVKEGHARETICAIADSGAFDLLVMGKHADSNLRNLLFGQIANYVIQHTKCPILIV